MMRGLHDPVRSYEQAKTEIRRTRREQFLAATPAMRRHLVRRWLAQMAVEFRTPDTAAERAH